MTEVSEIFGRHERIAFQLSGGKDSVAALLFLRDYWNRLTVYFCDSGDMKPALSAVVASFASMVPSFVLIPGRVAQTHAEFGLPSDLIPYTSTPAAHMHNVGSTPLMQDRVACCARSIMYPLHERMLADKVTLIIRGQKLRDIFKGKFVSGDVVDGIEFYYPVESWTDDDCFVYTKSFGFDMEAIYSTGVRHSGDCESCTAWLGEGRASYLRANDSEKFNQYQSKIRKIGAAVAPILDNFRAELEACNERV